MESNQDQHSKTKRKKGMFLLEKDLNYVVSVPRRFVRLLIKVKSNLIELNQVKEELINPVFSKCVMLLMLLKKFKKLRDQILSTPEFPPKNSLMTFLDNMNMSSPKILNTLHIYLFKILAQELISKEKALTPFWTPVFLKLSETLPSPIEIECRGSVLNSLDSSLKSPEEPLQLLTIQNTKVQNKNSQKISYQLYKYTVANPWVPEGTQKKSETPKKELKAIKIRIKTNESQNKIFNKWFDTSNFIYNKTVEAIKNNSNVSQDFLRNKIITEDTKTTHPEYIKLTKEIEDIKKELKQFEKEKNQEKIEEFKEKIKLKNINKREFAKSLPSEHNELSEWEKETPKEIRASSLMSVFDARKSAITNLRNGNITHFKMSFRKKKDNNYISLQKNLIQIIKKGNKYLIKIAPYILGENMYFVIGKKSAKDILKNNIQINNDCKMIRQNGKFSIIIPEEIQKVPNEMTPESIRYCGVDAGVRTFMTTFGNTGICEYNFKLSLLTKLDDKIKILKNKQITNPRPRQFKNQKRIRKQAFNKRELKKTNYVNELHWKTIKHLLKNNDVIFYGDIKSHSIVKNKEFQNTLNRNMNNLKFYKFKERLLFKANCENKRVYVVNESYTTKTCSKCGELNDVGDSKIFHCKKCDFCTGRDINSPKCILMIGLESLGIY